MIVSPGDSRVPANMDPNITQSAPAAIALVISPVCLTHPSATIVMLDPFKAL